MASSAGGTSSHLSLDDLSAVQELARQLQLDEMSSGTRACMDELSAEAHSSDCTRNFFASVMHVEPFVPSSREPTHTPSSMVIQRVLKRIESNPSLIIERRFSADGCRLCTRYDFAITHGPGEGEQLWQVACRSDNGLGDHDSAIWQSLTDLVFSNSFDKALDNVALPNGLKSLNFGGNFNQSLDKVTFPSGLQELVLGGKFNQSLDNVTLPSGLQELNLGGQFNQSLDNVTFPIGLQEVILGRQFNQSLDNVTLPSGLQTLVLGGKFDRRLDNVTFPSGLHELILVGKFNQIFDTATLPSGSLKLLYRGRSQLSS